MAEYFDTVASTAHQKGYIHTRMKDGKPTRMATPEEAKYSPRVIKVIRLESYEDALNNITFDEESGQQMLRMFGDEYC
jgi:adenine-specific DNA-methyltransferase